MAIFNDLYYAEPRSSYVKKPVQEFANVAAIYQDQYDKGVQSFDAWNTFKSNLPARDALKGQLQQEVAKYEEQWKPLVDKGNYEDAAPVLRKISQDFVANPIIKGITEDYASYTNAIKEAQDRLAKGKITAADFQKEVARSNKRFSQPLEYDPLTSQYKNKFNNFYIPDNVNIEEEVSKRIDKIKSGNIPLGYDEKGNPQYISQGKEGGYINTTTATGVSEDQIAKVALDYLNSNDEVNQLLAYRADLDAELRDGFTKPDLVAMGVMSPDGKSQIPDLINEDGSVNQDVAKQAYVLREKQNVVDYAKGYAYKNLDIKSKQDIEAEHRWQLRRDEVNRNFAKADAAEQKVYIKAFQMPDGAVTNFDDATVKAFFGTKADMNNMTISKLSPELQAKLGSAADVETAALVQEIKDKINKIKIYRNEIKGTNDAEYSNVSLGGFMYDNTSNKKKSANAIGKTKSEINTLLTTLAKKDPKYSKYLGAIDETQFNTNLLDFQNEIISTLDEKALKELETASIIDKELKGLMPIENTFRGSTKFGNNNVSRTPGGIKVNSAVDISESEYEKLSDETKDYLKSKDLIDDVTKQVNGKDVKTYTLQTELNVYPASTAGLIVEKGIGLKVDPNRMDKDILDTKFMYNVEGMKKDLASRGFDTDEKLQQQQVTIPDLNQKGKTITTDMLTALQYSADLTANGYNGAVIFNSIMQQIK